MKKILFLIPYPLQQAPSQRFRFEQYLTILEEQKFDISFQSFLDDKTWSILYKKGNNIGKAIGILKGLARRVYILFKLNPYDLIFIHREATPLGPPFIEWFIAKVFKKKIVFDFDDAIWMANTSKENAIASFLKFHGKTASIIKWSHTVSCGNQFIANYASKYNQNVVVNPTTIDTDNLHVPAHQVSSIPIIGWTGTHSTAKYLKAIIPILEILALEHQFVFKVISNQALDYDLPFLQYVAWNEETEITELNTFDIGIMPLTDDAWAKGKCGFKALQYMALETPALVSPVGINTQIVDDGTNGFHCNDDADWLKYLKVLLMDAEKRKSMGKLGRKKVIKQYSVISNKANFIEAVLRR